MRFKIAAVAFAMFLVGCTAVASDTIGKRLPAESVIPTLSTSLQMLSRVAQGEDLSLHSLPPFTRDSIQNGEVTVIVEPQSGNVSIVDAQAIRMLGGEVDAVSDSLLRVQVPADRIEAIAEQVAGIAFIREPFPAVPMAITSQGVALTGADIFHTAGHDGSGVRVAIIDLGFAGLSEAQASGELANVVFTHDYTGDGLQTGESHGTGVAEVVEDMAPGASLYLMRISDSVDLQNAVADCIAQGVDVINHSVGWYNTNYYDGTGTVASIVNNARSNGILWVNSAGNEAADGHWQSMFIGGFPDSDGDGLLNFAAASGEDYVDSDGWDEGNRVDLARTDTLVVYMSWDDWAASNQDYDLYLYNSAGEAVASSTNWQSGFQAPTEAISYTPSDDIEHTYTDGRYEIVIHAYDAPDSPDIEFYAFRTSNSNTNLEYHDPTSTILTPGNSEHVLAVGAIRWANWTTGPQEAFSSRGPSNASKYADALIKPDLAGPDGVSNWTYGFFYGTSASSPHVAGAAALLLSEDPSRNADELQTLLEASAIDMGGAGKDNVYGAGRLNLELSSLPPSPPAQVTDFAASDGEDGQSTLTWTNPADADLAQVVVQRAIGAYPTDHTDGVTVYDNAGPVPGGSVNITDTGLTNETTYWYAVFSRDTGGDWNETVTAGSNADMGTPAGAPPEPGDVAAHWDFDEGGGAVLPDQSGNGNDGTISGASWTTSVDGSGALSFDGFNDVVTVPDSSSLDISGALTLEAWVRYDGRTSIAAVVNKQNAYFLRIRDGRVQFYLRIGGVWRSLSGGTTSLTTGIWYHIAGVYDGTEMRVYLDGALDGARFQSGTVGTSNEPVQIGQRGLWNLPGVIDEVWIHGRALDPGELHTISIGPHPSPPAQVSDFAASDGEDAQSTLTWTNPSDADLAQVVVKRTTGSYPIDPTDGATVYDDASPAPGGAVSLADSGLTNGTSYFYAVFGRDADGSWNETVTAGSNADIGTPAGTPPSPPAQVSDFTASDGEDGQSTLTWTNPSDADLAQVVVKRTTGSYPIDPTDGTTVYDNASPAPGGVVSTVDSGLVNGTAYFYAVFGRDADGSWNETVTAGSNADIGTPLGSSPPPSDAAAYWDFEEGSGAVLYDQSGNGNDGTILGPSWTTSVDGSGALSFNGIHDVVTVVDSVSLDITGQLTIEAWVRYDRSPNIAAVVNKQNAYFLRIRDGRVQFYLTIGGVWRSLYGGTTTLETGVWYHIAGVYDGAEMRVYLDGILDGATLQSGAIGTSNEPVQIGQRGLWYLPGVIDEVWIHDRALDPGELHTIPGGPPPTPPAQVVDFAASDAEDGQSTLTWTNPSDADLAQVKVQRKTGGYPADPIDGVTVYDNSNPVPGGAVSTVNSGLTNGTAYYYVVFGRDADGSWNDTVTDGSNADTGTPAGASPPPSDAVAYWRFDEGAGTVAGDSSGHGNEGTIVGASWTTSVDGSGALSFDGVNDYVSVADSVGLDITGELTLEAWVRYDGSPSIAAVASKQNAYFLRIRDGRVQFYLYIGGVWRSLYGATTTLTTGIWYHIAGVYDGSEMRVYLDGTLDGARAQSGAIGTSNDPVEIGRRGAWNLKGVIDEVRIHDRAIDPGEFVLSSSVEVQAESAWHQAGQLIRVLVYPNPIRTAPARLKVEGADAQQVDLEIFDLSGRSLYRASSGTVEDLVWDLTNQAGEAVANGPYLCHVTVWQVGIPVSRLLTVFVSR